MRKNYPNNCFFPTGESCPGSGPVCPILFRCGAPLPRGFRLFSQVQYSKIHFFLPAIKYMHILRHQGTSHFFSRVFASPGKGCLVENGAGPPSKTEQCGCTPNVSSRMTQWGGNNEECPALQYFLLFFTKKYPENILVKRLPVLKLLTMKYLIFLLWKILFWIYISTFMYCIGISTTTKKLQRRLDQKL